MRIKNREANKITRLPRLGKIRLGIKAKNAAGVEYPKEVDYFVVPDEVQRVYGAKPLSLGMIFPTNDDTQIYTQFYASYGSNGKIKCRGDGNKAERRDEKGDFFGVPCPGPAACDFAKQHGCSARYILQGFLPKVSMSGIYELNTGSITGDINIRSGFGLSLMLFNRIRGVPFRLERIATKLEHEGKMTTHHVVRLVPDVPVDFINRVIGSAEQFFVGQQFALPAPEIERQDKEDQEAAKDPDPLPAPVAVNVPSLPSPEPSRSERLSDEASRQLQILAGQKGLDFDDIKPFLMKKYNVMTISQAPKHAYNDIKAFLDGHKKEDNPKTDNIITGQQLKRLFALMKNANMEESILDAYLSAKYNGVSKSKIRRVDYETICNFVEGWKGRAHEQFN